MGHGCMLHWRWLSSVGHTKPPCRGDIITLRVRSCVAPPQDLQHGPHALHSDVSQLTGHGP